MRDLETARLLLNMAQKDLQVLEILAAADHAPVEGVGFHAQQAVEKAFKASFLRCGAYPPPWRLCATSGDERQRLVDRTEGEVGARVPI